MKIGKDRLFGSAPSEANRGRVSASELAPPTAPTAAPGSPPAVPDVDLKSAYAQLVGGSLPQAAAAQQAVAGGALGVGRSALGAPLGIGRLALPEGDFLVDQIIGKVCALDDPSAQPDLDAEAMLYTPDAATYAFRRGPELPLWGSSKVPHYRQVRLDMGDMGAALASLVSADPDALMRLIGRVDAAAAPESSRRAAADAVAGHVSAPLYRLQLHLGRPPAAPGLVHMHLDGQLPMSARGQLLGVPPSLPQAPPADIAAWPLLVGKGLLKLMDVLRLSHGTAETLSWAVLMRALSGRQVETLNLAHSGATAQARRQLLEMARRSAQQGRQAGQPASVRFRDAADLAQAPPLLPRGSTLRAAMGGLGLRLQLQGGILDMMLLAHHAYAIVGFDDPYNPTRVLLYNPLGYNPQSAQKPSRVRQADFFVPEDLAALPRAQGSFWLPIAALLALGHDLSFAL